MNTSRSYKKSLEKISRPASSGKKTQLSSLQKKRQGFNDQNQLFISLFGNILPVEGEAMKQTMHSCIIPLMFIHPRTQNQNTGTAFLIASNIAITSAHNIYDKDGDQFHWNFQLRPSIAGIAEKDYEIQSYFVPEEFIAETEPKRSTLHDYAFIKLKEPVERQNYLMLTINFNSYKEILAIYGYPGSRYQKKKDEYTVVQYGLERQDDINEDYEDKELKRLRYNISTQHGQSGCPVVIGRGERNKVIAIHKGGNKDKKFNYGRLITKDIVIKLEKWRKQHKGAQFECFNYSTNTTFNIKEKESYFTGQISLEKQKGEFVNPKVIKNRLLPKIKKEQKHVPKEPDYIELIIPWIFKLAQPTQDCQKLNLRKKKEEGPRDVFGCIKKPSFWNEKTNHAQQFSIYNKIATKKFNNGMFQITSSAPVSKQSSIIFNVHSYSKTIILGLTKAKNINFPYSGGQNMKGSIALSTNIYQKSGKIIIDGEVKNQNKGFFIKPGESLTIEVSLKLWFIYFHTGKKSYWCTIDQQFWNGEWYIFASLKQEGDRVEVIM